MLIVLCRVVQFKNQSKSERIVILDKIYKILPKYAVIPSAASIVLNMLVYFGSRIITTGMYHYDFSISIDDYIPFISEWMIIYVLAYVVWVVGFIIIGRESREVCYDVLAAEQVAKLLSLACFLIIPSTMIRPEITGTGFCEWLSRLIYDIDNPDNLFPSIHCLESWICFRGAMKCKKVGNSYKIFMFVAAILVFASTLLVKQHVFVDVLGGIATVEIGLFVSRKFRLSRIYYGLENKRKIKNYE